MHEYTCAVVSVLILCFFLVLRIFWEEQLAEQFWYFNFSLYLVVFWAEQSKKAPCIIISDMVESCLFMLEEQTTATARPGNWCPPITRQFWSAPLQPNYWPSLFVLSLK